MDFVVVVVLLLGLHYVIRDIQKTKECNSSPQSLVQSYQEIENELINVLSSTILYDIIQLVIDFLPNQGRCVTFAKYALVRHPFDIMVNEELHISFEKDEHVVVYFRNRMPFEFAVFTLPSFLRYLCGETDALTQVQGMYCHKSVIDLLKVQVTEVRHICEKSIKDFELI
jgi:hypothetical protein